MARLIRNIAVMVLLLAFLLPAIGYAVGMARGDAVSTGENRRLAGFPTWEDKDTIRSFTPKIDAHLKDRFGFRRQLIDVARNVKDNLGEDPPLVVRGEGLWLFLGEDHYRDEFEGQGRWKDEQVDDWVRDLSAASAFFAERDIPFIATLAPDKSRIYPEKLPQDWTQGGRRFFSRVLSAAELTAEPPIVIDVEPLLLTVKAAGEPAYWQRDSHWAPSGNYPVAMAVLDYLDPEGVLPRYDGGDLAMRGAPVVRGKVAPLDLETLSGETETSEPVAMARRKPAREGYTVAFPHMSAEPGVPQRGALATKIITDGMDDGAKGTLVILGDSFADVMVEHWTPSFERIVKIHHGSEDYDVGTDEIMSYDPDAVLLMIVERSAARKTRPILVGTSRSANGAALPIPD